MERKTHKKSKSCTSAKFADLNEVVFSFVFDGAAATDRCINKLKLLSLIVLYKTDSIN
jgi:hypothetical protein